MKTIALYASLLAILFVALSVRTLRLRRTLKIGIGDAGNAQMVRAMRVHSNFAEYVPLSLILVYFVEVQGASTLLVHALGICLLIGRVSHAYGVSQPKENYNFRIAGMAMTFAVLVSSALYLMFAYARAVGAMTHSGPWRTEDFESLSWHDVHVHGLRFAPYCPDEGAADLVLDIDYILKWEKCEEQFLFTVCRAELTFHRAFRIKLELDYSTPTAGMCPFSIDGINREALSFPTGFKSYRWSLPINWPRGSMEFEAPGFTLTLIGEPIVQATQSLSSERRASGL